MENRKSNVIDFRLYQQKRADQQAELLKKRRKKIVHIDKARKDALDHCDKEYRDRFGFYVRRRETIEAVARARNDARVNYGKTVREMSAGIF